MNENPSILSHVSLGTNQFAQATAFYDRVLAALNIGRVLDLSEHHAVAYGRAYPEFWIQAPYDSGTRKLQTARTSPSSLPAVKKLMPFMSQPLPPAQKTTAHPARVRITAKNITAVSFVIWTAIKLKPWHG